MDEDNKAVGFKLKYDEIMRKAAKLEKGGLRPRPIHHDSSRGHHPVIRELMRRALLK